MPTTLVTDNFTDSNGTALASHTVTGGTWATVIGGTGGFEVQSNKLRETANTGVNYGILTTTSALGNNQQVNAIHNAENTTAGSTFAAFGVGCRINSGQTQGYLAIFYSERVEFKLFSIDAGSFTQLGSTYVPGGFSNTADYAISVVANGTSISAKWAGSTVIGPVTDSAATAGKAGVASIGFSDASLDTLEVIDLDAGGGSSIAAISSGFHTRSLNR